MLLLLLKGNKYDNPGYLPVVLCFYGHKLDHGNILLQLLLTMCSPFRHQLLMCHEGLAARLAPQSIHEICNVYGKHMHLQLAF